MQFEHSRGPNGQLTPQTWESATYHSIEHPALRGQIQIQPPAEP